MTINEHPEETVDLIIIGGGPAGMSAALVAGRAMLSTVVINAEQPRNAVTTASHGLLTRDGAHPSELLAEAKRQLQPYETVSYLTDSATEVTATTDGFAVDLRSGRRLQTSRLVVATGQRDDLTRLDLPGIDAVYGRSVYPCLFCDGFEHRGQRLALFGRDGAVEYAAMACMWSDDVVVFTNGAVVGDVDRQALAANGVALVTDPVAMLHSDDDGSLRAVELADGRRIERDAGFIGEDYSGPATPFAERLGVTSSPGPWGVDVLDADDFGKTNVERLYVIGDAKTGFGGLVAAAAEGAACASGIVHELSQARWVVPEIAAAAAENTTAGVA